MAYDASFFKTPEEVRDMLGGNLIKGDMVSFLESDVTYMLFTRKYDVERVYTIRNLKTDEITYPISLPSDVEIITLSKGTLIYRYHKEEGPKIDAPRFYAESPSFRFDGVASASGSGAVSAFTVLEDLRIVNFDKRWRSHLWGGDDDNDNRYPMTYEIYEHMLYTICKNAGAQGWRAACFNDQWEERKENKSFDAPKEFEIALFSSEYVKKMELRF